MSVHVEEWNQQKSIYGQLNAPPLAEFAMQLHIFQSFGLEFTPNMCNHSREGKFESDPKLASSLCEKRCIHTLIIYFSPCSSSAS